MEKKTIMVLIINDIDKTRRGKRTVNQMRISKLMGIAGGDKCMYIHKYYRQLMNQGVKKPQLTNVMIAGEIFRYLLQKSKTLERTSNPTSRLDKPE